MDRPHIPSKRDPWAWASLLVLPACLVAALLTARTAAGPTWLWFNLDPDYFYLFDAVNVVNLTTPGHVFHPGATLHWLSALVLKAAHPLSGGPAIADAVLADPERHLRLISDAFIALNAIAAVGLGIAGWRAFGRLPPAWLLQTAPLLSTLVVRHGHHVKPEALLVATTLALISAAAMTLEADTSKRHRLAVAFGAIAGFGVATKVTALPIFVLPLFVVGNWRAVGVYAASAVLALVVFTLPMAGAYDAFFAWLARVSQGSGAYGGGPSGVVDWAAYPRQVAKVLARPVLHVPVVLALAALAWAAWRRRQGRPLPTPETRLLAGVAAAVVAQALLVGKQPNAMYMIPSMMLGALGLAVLWRLVAAAAAGRGRATVVDGVFAVALAALVAAGGAGVVRLAGELARDRAAALVAADDGHFARCTRVYSYAASSPSFALMLGDYVSGGRHAERLAGRKPAGEYWLEHWWDQSRVVFRDWRGPADIDAALARAPCTVFRGTHWPTTEPLLMKLKPDLRFDVRCQTGAEVTVTRGVGCDGGALGKPPSSVDRPGASR